MPVYHEDNLELTGWTGINRDSSPERILQSELTDCKNWMITSRGELVKRPGMYAYADTLSNTGIRYILGTYIDTTGVYKPMAYWDAGGSNKKAYWWNAVGGVWTEITTLAGLTIYDGLQFNNAFYFATSAGVHKYTTGTTSSLLSGSPTDLIQLISFQTQIFGIKGSVFYYTDFVNPDLWTSPGGGSNPVYPGDGDNLTAMCVIQDRILLFKLNSTWILYLSDDPAYYQIRGVNAEIGCTTKKAVRNVRGIVYFMSARGLWATDGVAFTRISDPISPEFGYQRYIGVYDDDSLSVWDDYLIMGMHSGLTTFNRAFAYRLSQPRGFTELTFGGNFELGKWGLVRVPDPQNLASFVSSGVRPGKSLCALPWTFPDPGTSVSSAETVSCQAITAALDVDRISRIKRMKYGFMGLNAYLTFKPTYAYLADYDLGPDIKVNRYKTIESIKIRAPGYCRVFQMVLKESSTTGAGSLIMHLNFVNQLRSQQILGEQ